MTKTANKIAVSDTEIDAAIAAAEARNDPRAVAARYDRAADRIVIDFDNGNSLHIARRNLQGLAKATVRQLEDIEIEGPGTGLNWPKLGVDHYIPDVIRGVFGTRRWMSTLGRAGGAAKTEAKVAAARRNGLRGGRPRAKP